MLLRLPSYLVNCTPCFPFLSRSHKPREGGSEKSCCLLGWAGWWNSPEDPPPAGIFSLQGWKYSQPEGGVLTQRGPPRCSGSPEGCQHPRFSPHVVIEPLRLPATWRAQSLSDPPTRDNDPQKSLAVVASCATGGMRAA